MRPGPGWVNMGGAVWDHQPTGIRIHTAGLIGRPGGVIDNSPMMWPGYQDWQKYTLINGGNSKRGLMVLALKGGGES